MRHRSDRDSRARRRSRGGFTLLEVMLALSILAIALVGLIGRTTSNIRMSEEVAMRGVATELARSKMYDIEEELLEDGFQELDQSSDGDFDDEGWPKFQWEAKVEKIELPGLGSLESMQQGEGEGSGEGGEGGVLGGILSMGGGFGGQGGEGGDMSKSFISSQYEILSQVLEESIRKVTLTVTWKVGTEEQDMVVVCYFTDPSAIGRVIPGAGAGGIGGGVGGGAGGGGRGGGVGTVPGSSGRGVPGGRSNQ